MKAMAHISLRLWNSITMYLSRNTLNSREQPNALTDLHCRLFRPRVNCPTAPQPIPAFHSPSLPAALSSIQTVP